MLPMIQEKTTLIAPMSMHIDFVIPDKFILRNVGILYPWCSKRQFKNCKTCLTPKFSPFITSKSKVEYSPIDVCKIRFLSFNLEDKIHLEGGGNVMTRVLNKLFEFR